MPKTYCLINHTLTQKQIEQLHEVYDVEEIIYPPENIKQGWSNISPEITENDNLNKQIISWLNKAVVGDLFLVQGEFGHTFMLVDYALKHKLKPIYATTKRIASEQRNGEKVLRQYVFEHVCFKEYKYFSE